MSAPTTADVRWMMSLDEESARDAMTLVDRTGYRSHRAALESTALPIAEERDRSAAAFNELRNAITPYLVHNGPICTEHDSEGDPDCTDCQIVHRIHRAMNGGAP